MEKKIQQNNKENEREKPNKRKKESLDKENPKEKNLLDFEEYLNILLRSVNEENENDPTEKYNKISLDGNEELKEEKNEDEANKNKKNFNRKSSKNSSNKVKARRSKKPKEKCDWNRLDDIRLIEHIEKFSHDWKKISQIMGKPEHVLKTRFERRLNPRLKFTKFTPEEDAIIIRKYKIFGSSWNNISKYLPNRSSIMIKNRFYSNLKKRINEDCMIPIKNNSIYSNSNSNVRNESINNTIIMNVSNSQNVNDLNISNFNVNNNNNSSNSYIISPSNYISNSNQNLYENNKFYYNNNNNLFNFLSAFNSNSNYNAYNNINNNINDIINNSNYNQIQKYFPNTGFFNNNIINNSFNFDNIFRETNKFRNNIEANNNNNNNTNFNENSFINENNYYSNFIENNKNSIDLNNSSQSKKIFDYSEIHEEKIDININEINNNLENFAFENKEKNSNNIINNDMYDKNNLSFKDKFTNKNFDNNKFNQKKLNKIPLIKKSRNDIDKPFSIFTTTNSNADCIIKKLNDISSFNLSNNDSNNMNFKNMNNESYLLKKNGSQNENDDISPKGLSYHYFRKNSDEDKKVFNNIKHDNNKSEHEKNKMELDEINIFSNLNQNNNLFDLDNEQNNDSLYTVSCHNHCGTSTKSEIFNCETISNSNSLFEKEINVNEFSNSNANNDFIKYNNNMQNSISNLNKSGFENYSSTAEEGIYFFNYF